MAILIQYIRDEKNQPFGVVVATSNNGNFSLGWSVCNKKDTFNKSLALEIAIGRAMSGKKHEQPVRFVKRTVLLPEKMDSQVLVPYVVKVDAVQEMVNHMRNRALKYFRVKELV